MKKIKKNRKKLKKESASKGEKFIMVFLVIVFIISIFAIYYASKSLIFGKKDNSASPENPMVGGMSKMSFTTFDVQLAKKLMDENGDGKCDSCGMPVEMCIDSGELECSMDSKSTIGKLDSAHIHADWKVYINSEPLDFTGKDHMTGMKSGSSVSSFIHVDSGAPAPEKIGDILHMHAKGVFLWIFFESLGMKFNKDCLTIESGEKYCNDGTNTLKFYVNGELNSEFENYVFNDLNKILISYGDETGEELQQQLNSITDFAKVH